MHQDMRELTVSLDHLKQAHEEITLAMGQPERSIAEAAARRALDHLNMVNRRLEHARSLALRDEAGTAVERAYNAMRIAWQGTHDALNNWPRQAPQALDTVRMSLL